MKVSLLYFVISCSFIGLCMANASFGQGLDKKVTIEMDNEDLTMLFTKLKQQTGLSFVLTGKVAEYKGVSFVSVDRTVREVLDHVLAGKNLGYRFKDNTVFIYESATSKVTETKTANDQLTVHDQQLRSAFSVSGKILDASTQEALAGVNIVVKGTTRGTTTDATGKFVIDAEDKDVLVFSFIGFKPFETEVNGRTVIDVTMEPDATALKEVEVRSTGYWTDSKEKSTGNIAKVSAKEIQDQPVTSPLMALQGRMAGVDVTPITGVAGSAIKIQIRGQNSMRADGSYPLYIIDGVPVDSRPLRSSGVLLNYGIDPLNTINPANIESIQVLKDADATSIYGSRGANGVILITTKKGSAGKTNFTVSASSGIGQVGNKIDLLNTTQYLEMRNEAFANDGVSPGALDVDVNGTWDNERYTDWQEALLGGNSNVTDVQAGVSGGNANTSFRFGGGFHKETAVIPGNFSYHNITSNFSLSHTSPNKKLGVTLSVNYGSNKNNLISESGFVLSSLVLPPNAPALYDENGNINWQFRADGAHSWINPLSYLGRSQNLVSGNLVANTSISYEIVPKLQFRANLGYTDLNSNDNVKIPISSRPPNQIATFTGTSTFGTNKRKSWIIEPQLTYSKAFDDHHIDAIIGTSFQESTSSYQSIRGTGYTSDALLNSLQAAPIKTVSVDDNVQYRYTAVFARLGYNFKGKYLLNLTGRRDGSSRFGPNNRFGNFGAAGIGWIFSKESLIANNLRFVSFGKLRASYGTTGSDQIGDYQFYNTYSLTVVPYQNVSLNPTALYNPDYAWELTKKLEAALELGLADDRIMIEASWYRNRSSNQLVDNPLPATTGFPSVLGNFDAIVENSGWEFLLNTINVSTGKLRWRTSINVTIQRNKLVKFDGLESSAYSTLYKVGEPLNIQRLYVWKGVNPQTGLHELLDANDDGSITDSDKQFMDPVGRDYYGGFLNTITYRAFELSFLFQFSKGTGFGYMSDMPGLRSVNQQVGVMNRWQQEGDVTDVAKFTRSGANTSLYNNVRQSSRNVADASFIRLKTLSLSYALPGSLLSRAHIQESRIYLQGQNLFTITDFDNVLDPETINTLPPLRIIMMGIQFKF